MLLTSNFLPIPRLPHVCTGWVKSKRMRQLKNIVFGPFFVLQPHTPTFWPPAARLTKRMMLKCFGPFCNTFASFFLTWPGYIMSCLWVWCLITSEEGSFTMQRHSFSGGQIQFYTNVFNDIFSGRAELVRSLGIHVGIRRFLYEWCIWTSDWIWIWIWSLAFVPTTEQHAIIAVCSSTWQINRSKSQWIITQ